MFTGYVREVGEIVAIQSGRLSVRAPRVARSIEPGAPVAVAGVSVCATAVQEGVLEATLSAETRQRSTLGDLRLGAPVNVEPPLCAGSPVAGHLVQGFVDAIGKVARIEEDGGVRRVWFKPPARLLEHLMPKGAIAVDGVSLAVAEVHRDRFRVDLVPTTLVATTLGSLAVGDRVNLETDVVARVSRRMGHDARRVLLRSVATLAWSGPVWGASGVEKCVSQIAAGGAIVVWDPDREGEGDVIVAGAQLRPETVAFILTEARGHTTVPCARELLGRLEIPAMPGAGDHHGTAMHVPVDLAAEPGTGVSARERAATVRRLAAPDASAADFIRPGHVFPLAARDGLLSERRGHTEATVALCRAAGLAPVGVCCEIMSEDGTMAGAAELERRALEWGLPLVDIAELAARL